MFFPAMFLNQFRDRTQEREERRESAERDAVDWDEDKTKFDKFLDLRAETWKPFTLFDLKESCLPTDLDRVNKGKLSPYGKFAYVHQRLPGGVTLDIIQGQRRGETCFDGDVIIPTLLDEDGNVWMSYTPMEVMTQRQAVRRATGTVMIGGLGMGWLFRKVACKKSVKKIILVEISQELVDFYGNTMAEEIRREKGVEVEVIVDDVWNHVGKHGDDVRHLLDIWKTHSTTLTRREREIAGGVKHFWGWGNRH